MDAPRDVPQEIEAEELMAEKEKGKSKGKEIDDLPLAELSNPPTPEELKEQVGDAESGATASQTLASSGPMVPSFIGETVKRVMQEATENGIEVDMLGEGLAREQHPEPGAVLNPGEHIQVRFAR
jgi:PASTA domain